MGHHHSRPSSVVPRIWGIKYSAVTVHKLVLQQRTFVNKLALVAQQGPLSIRQKVILKPTVGLNVDVLMYENARPPLTFE